MQMVLLKEKEIAHVQIEHKCWNLIHILLFDSCNWIIFSQIEIDIQISEKSEEAQK